MTWADEGREDGGQAEDGGGLVFGEVDRDPDQRQVWLASMTERPSEEDLWDP